MLISMFVSLSENTVKGFFRCRRHVPNGTQPVLPAAVPA